MEEKILKYKRALIVQKTFSEFKKIGKLNFKCKCGKETNINGSTGHSKVCDVSLGSKMWFIKSHFGGYDKCVYCDSEINYDPNTKRSGRYLISFCSVKCKFKATTFLHNIKKCEVCEKTISSIYKTCSEECNKKSVSNSIKEWHTINIGTEKYLDRNKKIGEKSKIVFKGRVPWNKNLKGDEYLKHFIKNNRNTLHDALSKNEKWFIKTNLEINFEKILIDLDFKYKYCFFTNGRQFDFYIDLNDIKLLVEVDGDYWHKSSRRCKDINERYKKRQEDFNKFEDIKTMNSKYKWCCIRFWELNVNENKDEIIEFLKEIKNKSNIDEKIIRIEEYYKKYE